MKTKSAFLPILSILTLAGLSGCAKYRVQSLKPLIKKAQLEKNSISFSYKLFNRAECIKYLDRNVIQKGYQPIQITFVNNTNRYFTISEQSLSFECVSAKEVAESVHTNTVGRAAGFGVAALIVWPFIIPAIVDGIGSAQANEQLDADFAAKALSKTVIAPYCKCNGLVFVSTDMQFDGEFTLTISDLNGKQFILSTEQPSLKI